MEFCLRGYVLELKVDVEFLGDSVGEQVAAGNNNEKPRFLKEAGLYELIRGLMTMALVQFFM
jgi:hypothetical protein